MAPSTLGVDFAFPIGELNSQIGKWLENRTSVWFPFATHTGLAARVEEWLAQVRARVRFGVLCPEVQHDVCAVLDDMRLFKDEHELATMRRAATISAGAHVRAMQTSARMLRSGADAREYHLEAELLHEFRRHGAQFPAYTSIVAAGANACVLHYRAGAAPLKEGELVLIDAGCELDGYASDITRTFPAAGRFSAAQKDLYQIVLAHKMPQPMSLALVALYRPASGGSTDPVSRLARCRFAEPDLVGSLDDVIETRAYFKYYMHRTAIGWAWMSTIAAVISNPPKWVKSKPDATRISAKRSQIGPVGCCALAWC